MYVLNVVFRCVCTCSLASFVPNARVCVALRVHEREEPLLMPMMKYMRDATPHSSNDPLIHSCHKIVVSNRAARRHKHTTTEARMLARALGVSLSEHPQSRRA